jgi:hypothetical protein
MYISLLTWLNSIISAVSFIYTIYSLPLNQLAPWTIVTIKFNRVRYITDFLNFIQQILISW